MSALGPRTNESVDDRGRGAWVARRGQERRAPASRWFVGPRPWLALTAVVAPMATSPPVRAETANEVRAVTFDEDGGVTRVHVRGAQTPTFTVYKLERPSRVVIDLPQA